jgi:hypothetical protein
MKEIKNNIIMLNGARRLLLCILCHDSDSERQAERVQDSFFRDVNIDCRIVRLGCRSKYFENQVWNVIHYWQQTGIVQFNRDYAYVGLVTYKFAEKHDPRDAASIAEQVRAEVASGEHDVLALKNLDFYMNKNNNKNSPAFSRCSVIDGARANHGDAFVRCWYAMLEEALGFSPDTARQVSDAMPGFFCNFWIARTELFLRYCDFARSAMAKLDEHQVQQEEKYQENGLGYLAHTDSKYEGRLSAQSLLSIFGVPYYTMHPFLLERLPCFYFTLCQASIKRLGPVHPILLLNTILNNK